LSDRTLAVTLAPIAEEERRTEAELWAAVERVRPRVLGALLDAVATGLRRADCVQLASKPRMADFALWVTACEPGLGWENGSFVRDYAMKRAEAAEATLESSAVGSALLEVVPEGDTWTGTAGELLEALAPLVSEAVRRDRDRWPQNAQGMRGALRRLAPALRSAGVTVTQLKRDGKRRPIEVKRTVAVKMPATSSQSSQTSQGANFQAILDDVRDDLQPQARGSSPLSSPENPNLFGSDDVHDDHDDSAGTFVDL
jgi:hypothetical protein